MNISLAPELEEAVKRKVRSGFHNNPSEVIREALRQSIIRQRCRPRVPGVRNVPRDFHKRDPSDPSDQKTPVCPNCGSLMALRTAKTGKNAGSQFWGCSGYLFH